MPFLTTRPSSPCYRMELTTGNVDMHFANITIEVNSAGHDIFQRVSNNPQPSAATLNPPTSPTAKPATPTFDDYVPSPAHDVVRLDQTLTAPQPPPFSPLDMHPQSSHLASPQTPHLAPPPYPAPPALKQARTDAASPELLEAHDVTEKMTKQPRLRNAETAQIRHDLPDDWDSKSRGAKKYWMQSHK
jgi:hypothetical protein